MTRSSESEAPGHRGRLTRRLAIIIGSLVGVGGLLVVGLLARGDGAADEARLVVHHSDGRIATLGATGGDRVEITGPAPSGDRYQQPTWSPDGRRLAWVEVGQDATSIHISSGDGASHRSVALPLAPFYLSWSPDGSRLVGLGSVPDSIGAVLVDLTDDPPSVTDIDEGQPYYFDWSPEGDRILVHVGERRLEEVTVEGSERRQVGESAPGSFQAPLWSEDGTRVYAERGTIRHFLIVERRAGGRTVVADFSGSISFDLAGRRLAFLAVGGAQSQAVSAASSRVPAAPGVLTVADLGDASRTIVSTAPVLAFEWSPDGTKLLYLTPAEGRSGLVRWQVWDGEASDSFAAFTPTALYLREYAPFFDQYARSQTSWAPDSERFAYAGTDSDGVSGIWVQPLDAAGPRYVTEGEMVSWGQPG